MYHQSFLFVIISNNDRIERALSKIKPIEDCDYTFHTVIKANATPFSAKKADIALIYDMMGDAQLGQEKAKQECIFVMEQDNENLVNPDFVSRASGMWIMPGRGEYDETLLAHYFQHLAVRMKAAADARKQGICFDTLINSVPNLSWFKDVNGAHLIVNDSFCEMVGKTKEQIYKKGHCFIWDASKEDEEICLKSDQIIMDSRKTNSFEEEVKTRTDRLLLKSYKSALIDDDGQIFGTCGIAHDVTELRNMSTEMDMVLDSVPFAVLVEDMDDTVLNKNVRFDEYFPDFANIVGASSAEWKEQLNKTLVEDGVIKEVMIQNEEGSKVLVFEEEPILDIFKEKIGKIITLTDITFERGLSQQNAYRANTDYLTGLANRRRLTHYLDQVYSEKSIYVLLADLDNFKKVNDTYGHGAGDRALVKMAEVLNNSFPDGFVSRIGGDEFVVVLAEHSREEVQTLVERFILHISETFAKQKEFEGVTASVGVAYSDVADSNKQVVNDILHEADALLYKAKHEGKNRYCIADNA